MYHAAADGETSWEHTLLLTGLLYMDVAGLEVSPPPADKYEYAFYKLRLDILEKHPNNNVNYKNTVKVLQKYIYNKKCLLL